MRTGDRLQGNQRAYLVMAQDDIWVWLATIQSSGNCEVMGGKVQVWPVRLAGLEEWLAAA